MLLTIHEFKDDNTEHKYTSWKLASDSGMKNIEDSSTKSSNNLLAWESTKIIPTGDIWYISTYRHIYDSEGNELAREWSKPQPVFNEVSNITDALAPKYFIKDPFITDITYNPSTGLSFNVMPYEGNIGYSKSILELRDLNDESLLVKLVDISDSGEITIPPSELDFTEYNYIKISIMHIGLHNTSSTLFTTGYHLKDIYYTVVGNKVNLDPKTLNSLTIQSTNVVPVSILSATVNTMDGEFLANCTIDSDSITIPTILDYNNSYKIETTLLYTDENNTQRVINDTIYISTSLISEVENFDNNFTYEFKLEEVRTYSNDDDAFYPNIDYIFNSEEMFTHSIPIPDKRGYVSNFIYDAEYNTLTLAKSNVFNILNFSFQLLTEKMGIFQYISSVYIRFRDVKYDSYDNTLTVGTTFYPSSFGRSPAFNKTVYINGECYVFYVNRTYRDRVYIYKINLDDESRTYIKYFKLDNNIDDITISNYNDETIFIHIIGGDIRTSMLFNLTDNTVTDYLPIPDSFVNNDCNAISLRNGGIFVTLMSDEEGVLEYYYLAPNAKKLVTNKLSFPNDGKITNNIRLKNGKVLFISKGSEYTSLLELS